MHQTILTRVIGYGLLAVFVCACTARDDSTLFAPEKTEFAVRFPGKPAISELTGKGGLFDTPTTLQVATQSNPYRMLRAEATPIGPAYAKSLTKERLLAYGMSYGENQAFRSIEAHFEEKPYGRCVFVRGAKMVGGVDMTFLSKMCVGQHTLLIQYIASSTSTFPPSGGLAFLDSTTAH